MGDGMDATITRKKGSRKRGLPSKLHSGGPRSEGIGYVQAGVWPMGSVAGFREKLWGQVVYRA